MILSVGLTPAWQHILVFDEFVFGEVNRACEVHWCASGKVLNAAIAMRRLGGDHLAITPLGGQTGDAAARDLAELGVCFRRIPSRAATRVCTTLISRAEHGVSGDETRVTELVENAHPLAGAEYGEVLRAYSKEAQMAEAVLMTGSLPPGTSRDFYRDLLEHTPGKAVVDARGEELVRALELEPLVVKPNREELERTLGRRLRTEAELKEGMRELHRLGAVWVVISQGKNDLWIASRTDGFYRLRPPAAEVVNPIGCGDCMAGTIAWALGDGRTVLESVRLGVAASLENLGGLLPSRLERARVEEVAAGIVIDEVES